MHAAKVQNSTFSTYSTGLPQENMGSQDTMIQVGFRMQVAKKPIYPVVCQFRLLLYYVITIYQCYGQKDGHHAPSSVSERANQTSKENWKKLNERETTPTTSESVRTSVSSVTCRLTIRAASELAEIVRSTATASLCDLPDI